MSSTKGKEKLVDGGRSSAKRKRGGDNNENNGGGKRKNRTGVLQFFEDAAYEADENDGSDDSEIGDDFLEDEIDMNANVRDEPVRTPNFLIPKEEEMSEEELENFVEERYRPGSGFVAYAEDGYESKTSINNTWLMNAAKDPIIWKVKCMVGRERHSAFCLMQKYVDLQSLGTKLQIISAFSLDHVKGHIFIESDKHSDVYEACKGLCSIYSSRVVPVPQNEISLMVSVRAKGSGISVGMWARVKSGKYKGDLAQVVAVNDARKKVTVKLVPRLDLQALAEKFGGGVTAKKTAVPAPKLINSSELEEFRPLIQYRRDRDTNEMFQILDGMMLKDGYLYKKLSMDSLSFWGVAPTDLELLKFEPARNDESSDIEWLSQLYGESSKAQPKKNLKVGDKRGDAKGGREKEEGSSSFSVGNSYEVGDLVFFRRNDFGVVVGSEKDDSFKILKEGSEGGPTTVMLHVRELRNASFDKKLLTAKDQHGKAISVNDTVRVSDGGLKDKQGVVKQIYKGIIFLYNENDQEHNGYTCARAQICEKVILSTDIVSEKGTEAGTSSFADFSLSPKSPLFPEGTVKERESNFKARDDNAMFSVGQSLRIRVGPLKGYLCRVLAVRKSDVTVKLDSQQKILTVKCEHLSEVRARSSALAQGEDLGTAKSFDLLGTGGSGGWMDGVAATTDGERWNTGVSSSERSSWPSFSTSNFPLQPDSGSENAPNSWSNKLNKDAGDSLWETKVTPVQKSSWGTAEDDGNVLEDAEQNSSWGKKNEGWKQPAGAVEESSSRSWIKASDSIQGGSDDQRKWGQAAGKWSTDNDVGAETGDKMGAWGTRAADSGQPGATAWKKASTSDGQTNSWASTGKVGQGSAGWGGSNDGRSVDSLSGGHAEGNQEDSWAKATEAKVEKEDSWKKSAGTLGMEDAKGLTMAEFDTAGEIDKSGRESAWKKPSGGSSWSKSNDSKKHDGELPWGQKAVNHREDQFVEPDQDGSWKRPLSSHADQSNWSSGSKLDTGSSWTKQDGASGSMQGGRSSWGKKDGGSSWREKDGGSSWSQQANNGSRGESKEWTNPTDGQNSSKSSGGQNESGSAWEQPQGRSWSKQDVKSSWGSAQTGGSSWAVHHQDLSESESKGKANQNDAIETRRTSGGSVDGQSSWSKQNSSWTKSANESWSTQAGKEGNAGNKDETDQKGWSRSTSFEAGRGMGGRRGRGGRGNFGRGGSYDRGNWNSRQEEKREEIGNVPFSGGKESSGWTTSKPSAAATWSADLNEESLANKDVQGGADWDKKITSCEKTSTPWGTSKSLDENQSSSGWNNKSNGNTGKASQETTAVWKQNVGEDGVQNTWNLGKMSNSSSSKDWGQGCNWSTGTGDAGETKGPSWGDKSNWNSGSGVSWGKQKSEGNVTEGGDQNASNVQKLENSRSSTGWGASSNWSSGAGEAGEKGSSWGSKSNWKSGSGDTWTEQKSYASNDQGRSDNWGQGWRGSDGNGDEGRGNSDLGGFGSRGRGRSDRDRFRGWGDSDGGNGEGRGFSDSGGFRSRSRGRSDRGGFRGRWGGAEGTDDEGRGDSDQARYGGRGRGRSDGRGFRGRGGSDRGGFRGRGGFNRGGFSGRGRGRTDQNHEWEKGSDFGDDKSFGWNKGSNDGNESWRSDDTRGGGDSIGGSKVQWQSWSSGSNLSKGPADGGGSTEGGWCTGKDATKTGWGNDATVKNWNNQEKDWKSSTAPADGSSSGWNQGNSSGMANKAAGWKDQRSGWHGGNGSATTDKAAGWNQGSSSGTASKEEGSNDQSFGQDEGNRSGTTNEAAGWNDQKSGWNQGNASGAASSSEPLVEPATTGWGQAKGDGSGDVGKPTDSWGKAAASSWGKGNDG